LPTETRRSRAAPSRQTYKVRAAPSQILQGLDGVGHRGGGSASDGVVAVWREKR
jgi:hypothetical protein